MGKQRTFGEDKWAVRRRRYDSFVTMSVLVWCGDLFVISGYLW